MSFEWDPEKAAENLRKHGVPCEEAERVFDDPLSKTLLDPDHAEGEERYLEIGYSSRGRWLLVSYTERQGRVRIMSARHVTRKERWNYEERSDPTPRIRGRQAFTRCRGHASRIRSLYPEASRGVGTVSQSPAPGLHDRRDASGWHQGDDPLSPRARLCGPGSGRAPVLPDSDAANAALCGLMALFPAKRRAARKRRQPVQD